MVLAQGSADTPLQFALHSLRERSREEWKQRSKTPGKVFEIATRARQALDLLRTKVTDARLFTSDAMKRRSDGDLTEENLQEELVGAKVVIALADSLESLYSKAMNVGDGFALSRIAVAATLLTVLVDPNNLLTEHKFPEQSKTRTAERLRSDVYDALCGCSESLDLPFPSILEIVAR